MKRKVVVVGNGMVGHKFIEKMVELDQAQHFELITFCEEPRPAYDRVHLSDYFSNPDAGQLALTSVEWYQQQGVTLHLNDAVVTIDRAAKTVQSAQGQTIGYDHLVLATGSAPFVPPIPGIDKKGVFVYRTIEDLDQMMAYGEACKNAAVIGGGLLGLEAAKALVDMGLQTHVVEFAPRLMPRQIDQDGSRFLQNKIESLDVGIHVEKNTRQILGNGKVTGMRFADESELPVDMIVVSAGIRPRDELARAAGLEIGGRGGIVVNDSLQTSDPNIYAIGECALYDGMIYGLVAPGYRMAEIVCKQLLSESDTFSGADMSTKLKLLGVDVGSIGDAFANGTDVLTYMDSRAGVYKKLLISKEHNILKGAILVGDTADYGNLLQLYLNQMTLPDAPESLIIHTDGEAAGVGIDALPDTAQICSCENVCKGDILQAIQDGAHDLPAIKSCTKASTVCGSCGPMIKDMLVIELEKMGVAVNKSLCEHFPYTRQELLEIIKVTQIKTYDELLGRYGTGLGCEICKPAVASMLASTWNEHLMAHQNIQDTNDYYFANIQRNGTYSVVPRVPGGEITPKQLMRIGEVAHEFDLYTKITGGQRIDLFGAHLDQLPMIWLKLGEVGLETGHAYAKGVRTVKSCVGSTWCRFGVQDSTEMAIRLENRYKGLRAPHKLKFAVSGCARECAEAQCKDVGVIATEKGWNLYVCGNGGMKPRHADLLATDLDDETLIKYIDRFLMYYVRTADKLNRTSVWLGKLSGGLDQVRDVVVNDSLGLGEELEREMQYVVDTYQCEWQTTLSNEQMLKRFQHFANSDDRDGNIDFKLVRGQKQPA